MLQLHSLPLVDVTKPFTPLVRVKRYAKKYEQSYFEESEHPRDEKGRFVEKAEVEAIVKVGNNWVSGQLDSDQRAVLKSYTSPRGLEINGRLRLGDVEPIKKDITLLDQALDKSSIPNDAVLYRVFGTANVAPLRVGAIFSDKAYVSTSLDFQTAMEFDTEDIVGVMRIKASKGQKGGYVGKFSEYPDQFEMLLPRDSQFRIDRISKNSKRGLVFYDVTYLGPKGAKKTALEYQQSPEFEALHPRDDQGQFVEKAKVEAIKEGGRKWALDRLNSNHRHSLERYTQAANLDINAGLRSGEVGMHAKDVALLDEALDKALLPEGITLYRGFNAKDVGQLEVGRIFSDKAYVSTTLDYGIAKSFGPSHPGTVQGVMRIQASKGQKAGYVGGFSEHPEEFEVLFPRNSEFLIDGIVKDSKKGVVYYDVTYLGQGTKKFQKSPEFEALHPRDEQGQFVEKAKVEAVKKAGKRWVKSIDNDDGFALVGYSAATAGMARYKEVNNYLRGIGKAQPARGNEYSTQETVERIDRALKSAKLPTDLVLYRGMSLENVAGPKVGSTFTEKAYTSTSLDAGQSRRYVRAKKGRVPVFVRIQAKKGQLGAYLEPLNEAWGEEQEEGRSQHEVLLPRSSQFRISKISKDKKGLVYLDVTYLGQGKGK